jgi:exopolysaccharide biosynthesis polyprenyl glycosylphosphotransferase
MWWRNPWLRPRWILALLAIFDGLLIISAYNLLFLRQFRQLPGVTTSVGALLILWLGFSYLLGRYSKDEQVRRGNLRRRIFFTLAVASLVVVLVVLVLNWGLKAEDPRTFRRFLIPLITAVTGGSILAQLWVFRKQQYRRSFLLVGEENLLTVLRQELQQSRVSREVQLVYCPTDSSPNPAKPPLLDGLLQKAQHSQGELAGNDLRALGFDGLAISDSATLDDRLLQQLLELRIGGTSVCSLMLWAEHHLQRVPPELFTSRWLVQAEGFELQPGRLGWRIKRLGDLIVALLLLLLASPLIGLAALLILLEDGGPIFYSQERTGLFGSIIRIWKLRTMHTKAEAVGAQWAKRNDPRITKIGAWLRRTRIDELPQLVSVLKGEMSLIGPRPERPEIELDLEERIPHYRCRHWVRPGLSGWAQVCYPYGASIEDSRMKLSYDIFYLRNANLFLDAFILIKTIRLVFRAEGAVPIQAPASLPPLQSD